VRRSTSGRHQQSHRLLDPDTSRTRPDRRQIPLPNDFRLGIGGDQLRRVGLGGQSRPETATNYLRIVIGRGDVHLRPVLFFDQIRVYFVHVVALLVLRRVFRHVLDRRRVHPGSVFGRNVPGEHSFALFGHRVHHVSVLLVREQQGLFSRLPELRILHNVLDFCDHQLCVRIFRVQIRDRNERQNVSGNPKDPRRECRTKRRCEKC